MEDKTLLTCPRCRTTFPDTDCNTRRDTHGRGTLYHEAPLIVECPHCQHDFEWDVPRVTPEAKPVQHTPGPWKVHIQATEVQGMPTFVATVRPEYLPGIFRGEICYFQSSEIINGILSDECEANARAVAALPDLLAALTRLLAVSRAGLDQSATHNGLTNCDAIAHARAALAKATGGAQ